MSRRLPYIIGSEDFNKHDHLGLVTSSEDEDDENNSEVDEEEDDDPRYSRRVVPRSEIVEDDIKSRTQVNHITHLSRYFLVFLFKGFPSSLTT